MNKIRRYFTTFVLTRGLFIATLSSAFIYLSYFGFSYALLNTILGLLGLYLLLQAKTPTWFVSGAFIGLFWFWWIALSLIHYEMLWAVPLVVFIIMLGYGALFWIIAWLAEKISSIISKLRVGWIYPPRFIVMNKQKVGEPTLPSLLVKATGLLLLSYIHPFSFDWFKPELVFVDSYIGIEKWQFAIVLFSIILSIWKQQFLYLLLIVFASTSLSCAISPTLSKHTKDDIKLMTTHTSVQDKWNEALHSKQFHALFNSIDKAIKEKKKLIILPESVFPIFVNRSANLIDTLQEKAKHISIVTGGLYWDGKTPRNSAYIFTDGKITVANKVVLVPFGEANPLPDFLSDLVNTLFYDGAVDYKASKKVIDYTIDGVTYRNAICFEATSEKLYAKDKEGKRPQNMIVLSNNGWFTPSTEPILQKLLLMYYHKKYGTTIYHAVNMSESYSIKE